MTLSRAGDWAALGFAALLVGGNLILAPADPPLNGAPGEETDASATKGLWSFNEAYSALNGTFLGTAMTGLSLAGFRTRLPERAAT